MVENGQDVNQNTRPCEAGVSDMYLDHSVVIVEIFMRLEFGTGEIMEDEFFGGLALFRVDLDEDDDVAREDLTIRAKLAEQLPVGIQSIGARAQSKLGFMPDFRLEVVHGDF